MLSALDSRTQDQVVDRLFGMDGILRKHSTTVLLITHDSKCEIVCGSLRTDIFEERCLNLANHIVVLSRQGKIAQQGNFSELQTSDGYIRDLLLRPAKENDVTEARDQRIKPRPKISGPAQTEAFDLTRKTGDMAVYSYYFKSIGWPSALSLLLFAAVTTFMMYFPRQYSTFLYYPDTNTGQKYGLSGGQRIKVVTWESTLVSISF